MKPLKQFILSTAIILSVGAVFILNGLGEQVEEVSSTISSSSAEEAAESEESPLLVPADLGEMFKNNDAPSSNQAEVLPAELDYLFDAKFEDNGYIVEIYREFEIYRDANGNVIKEVPTANFEFIRYKK